MSVSGTYGVGGLSGVEGIWDMGSSARKNTSSGKGDSGDTVSISDKARELLREKLGRFSASDTTARAEAAAENPGGSVAGLSSGDGQEKASGAEGASGGLGGSSSVESIKQKIAALKSQLASLAGQASGGRADTALQSKINALEAQIAALEAQVAESAQSL